MYHFFLSDIYNRGIAISITIQEPLCSTTLRLVGEMEMQIRLVPQIHVMVEYNKEYFGCRVSLEGVRGPSPTTELTSSGFQARSPNKILLWKLVGISAFQVIWKATGNSDISLLNLRTDSPTGTHPGLQQKDSTSGGEQTARP